MASSPVKLLDAYAVIRSSPSPVAPAMCISHIRVPDTYAASHIQSTAISAGAAAEKASDNNRVKYNDLATTRIFVPSLWRRVAHGALNLLSLLKISEGESLQSPMNPLRQLTFTRGFPCHSNEAMQ